MNKLVGEFGIRIPHPSTYDLGEENVQYFFESLRNYAIVSGIDMRKSWSIRMMQGSVDDRPRVDMTILAGGMNKLRREMMLKAINHAADFIHGEMGLTHEIARGDLTASLILA